ncbi:MAG: hypothetical protein AAF892_06155 [Cyanobacteria bacterium P01_D01_bin.71]
MFQPTHWLVSPSRKIPVVVEPRGEKTLVFTEPEWGNTDTPAFELHARMGMDVLSGGASFGLCTGTDANRD